MDKNVYIDSRYLREDIKKMRKEGAEVVTWVLFLLTFPVISAAVFNFLKLMIKRYIPDALKSWDEDNLNAMENVFEIGDWLVKQIDRLATWYIKIIVKLLKTIPKLKNKSDEDLKHIAVTLYYTITVGLLLKVLKLLMLKKGITTDSSSMKNIRDVIALGLKLGSHGLNFDDIEKESDVMFSSKSFSPIVNQLAQFIGVKSSIFEYKQFFSKI